MARTTKISQYLYNMEGRLDLDIPEEGVIHWKPPQKQRRRSVARRPDEEAIPRIFRYGGGAGTSLTSSKIVRCDGDGQVIYLYLMVR